MIQEPSVGIARPSNDFHKQPSSTPGLPFKSKDLNLIYTLKIYVPWNKRDFNKKLYVYIFIKKEIQTTIIIINRSIISHKEGFNLIYVFKIDIAKHMWVHREIQIYPQ